MPPATNLSHCLSILSQVVPEDAATLVKDVPQEQILQALYATGSASIRHRKLPAEQIVWLVIGLSLFRHLPLVQIVEQLGLAVPKGPPRGTQRAPSGPSATGAAAAAVVVRGHGAQVGASKCKRHPWHGLGVYGVDGTTMRVADSEKNREYFAGLRPTEQSAGIRYVGWWR